MAFSKNATSILLVATFALLICMRGQAARLEPRSNDNQKPQGFEGAMKIGTTGDLHQEKEMTTKSIDQEETGECQEGEGLQACLMRRTLVAHTDYIYTQGKHN